MFNLAFIQRAKLSIPRGGSKILKNVEITIAKSFRSKFNRMHISQFLHLTRNDSTLSTFLLTQLHLRSVIKKQQKSRNESVKDHKDEYRLEILSQVQLQNQISSSPLDRHKMILDPRDSSLCLI